VIGDILYGDFFFELGITEHNKTILFSIKSRDIFMNIKSNLILLSMNLNTNGEEFSMHKNPGFLAKHKLFLFLLLIIVIVFPLLSLISINLIHSLNLPIQQVNTWINRHRGLFLFWHLLLLVAIYLGWGFKVEQDARKQHKELTVEQIKKAKRFRWLIILAVIGIDLLTHV
jgi:hypothetical protein